jgi:hypothetical protein
MVKLGAADRTDGAKKQARKKVWIRGGMRRYPPTFIGRRLAKVAGASRGEKTNVQLPTSNLEVMKGAKDTTGGRSNRRGAKSAEKRKSGNRGIR